MWVVSALGTKAGAGLKAVYWRGSPRPKYATSLISARLIATDIAWRKRRSAKTRRFSGSGEVTLKPKVAMAMVGRRSIA